MGAAKEKEGALDNRGDPGGVVGDGKITSYTMAGFVHILLVLAIVVVLVRVIQGRRII
jgi:hypothetical protein